jgi:hypothetical protein
MEDSKHLGKAVGAEEFHPHDVGGSPECIRLFHIPPDKQGMQPAKPALLNLRGRIPQIKGRSGFCQSSQFRK